MRTEPILIKPNNHNDQAMHRACRLAKCVFNVANYQIRQAFIEESYTSKASAIDLDVVPTYQDSGERIFSGRRIKRGLYKASSGKLINADVNGALNILRKEIGNAFAKGLFDSGCVFQPMRATC